MNSRRSSGALRAIRTTVEQRDGPGDNSPSRPAFGRLALAKREPTSVVKILRRAPIIAPR